MQDSDKELLRNLWVGLSAAAVGFGLSYAYRALDRRGPVATVMGTVVKCTERYEMDAGEVYTTEFSFVDAGGTKRSGATYGLHYCLPAGHGINLEYPVKNPSKARPLAKQ